MADYALRAFMPTGNSIAITAATTAPDGVQCLPGAVGNEPGAVGGGPAQFRVHNSGTVYVFMGFGASNTTAQTNANTAPAAGAPAIAIAIPPGAIEAFTLPRSNYFSFKSASSTATVYMTPGRGI